MAGSVYKEWLTRNANRAFPFEEDSDFLCRDGITVPNGLVLDARLFITGTQQGTPRLQSVEVFENGPALLLFSITDELPIDIYATSYFVHGSTEDTSYRMYLGPANSLGMPVGKHVLVNPPKLLSSRVVSIPYGIGADTITCGAVTATGEIRVANGRNTTLNIDPDGSLVLDVGRGLGKGMECPDDSGDGGAACRNALYYINGQGADSDGGFQIYGGAGMVVSSGTYNKRPAIYLRTSSVVNNFLYR